MTNFTPGPWDIDDGDSQALGIFAASDANAICYLSEHAEHGIGLRGPETDMANAHLIAAAPDMHRELRLFVLGCPCGLNCERITFKGTSGPHGGCTRCAPALSALAKAEGGKGYQEKEPQGSLS